MELISLLIYYAQVMRRSGREYESTSKFTFLTAALVGLIIHTWSDTCMHIYSQSNNTDAYCEYVPYSMHWLHLPHHGHIAYMSFAYQ